MRDINLLHGQTLEVEGLQSSAALTDRAKLSLKVHITSVLNIKSPRSAPSHQLHNEPWYFYDKHRKYLPFAPDYSLLTDESTMMITSISRSWLSDPERQANLDDSKMFIGGLNWETTDGRYDRWKSLNHQY